MVGARPATVAEVPQDIKKKSPFPQSGDPEEAPVNTNLKSPFPEDGPVDAYLKSPVHQLSEDLKLMEDLENQCPVYLTSHRNAENLTARQLFAKNRESLRLEGKTYLKTTAEHCTVVIILIATVAFAAAYTVPGGPDSKTGHPVLLGDPLFIVFTVTDMLSLGLALTAVVVFQSIITSPFRLEDFQISLPQKLLCGFTLLFLSVSMMMLSFAATIILTINSKQQWAKISLYIVTFCPVMIFLLLSVCFHLELLQTLYYSFRRIGKFLPRPASQRKPADATPLITLESGESV